MIGASIPAGQHQRGSLYGIPRDERFERWTMADLAFLAMIGKKPTEAQARPLQVLIGLLISNGPGAISAQGAKGAVSADGPQTPGRVQINKAMVGFLTHTGYSHGGNGFEGMAFLLDQFKDKGLTDPTDPHHGIDLKAMASEFARAYKREKAESREIGSTGPRALPGVHHPVFKGKPVNYDPRERFIAEVMAERGDYNVFHDFYRALVQALYEEGASPYVFCVNVDAVIAALLLALLWQDYRSGALTERHLETAAFTVFLYGRMIGSAAEIDDHLNRGRNMDHPHTGVVMLIRHLTGASSIRASTTTAAGLEWEPVVAGGAALGQNEHGPRMTTPRGGLPMQGPLSRRQLLGTGAAIAALALTGVAGNQAQAADFSGETIEYVIPFEVGGGSDTWARFNAPFLSKYLPGQPTVVVLNVPGGGSITGANQFAQRADPDGLTILGTSGSTQFPYLLDDPRVRYDYDDWQVVLASPTGGVVYINPDLGVSSAEDLGKLEGKQLVYGSQGATSLDLVPLLAFDLLGLDTKAVFGMKGRGDGRLAFERGEANIDYQTSSAYLTNVTPLVEAGKAVPLFSWGVLNENGEIVRDPSFPDLPHFAEFYEAAKREPPSGPAWDAWKAFFGAGFAAQKLIVLPEGTDDEIVEAYQEAVRQMKEDPEYQAGKEAVLGTYEQVTGEEAQALYDIAVNVPDEAQEWVLNWLNEKYDVTF